MLGTGFGPVLVAPTAFKGTLSAEAAARAIAAGVGAAWPAVEVNVLPLSDGGDGFLSALLASGRGRRRWHSVRDALGRPHRAPLGWLGAQRTAVLELALAVGIGDVWPPSPRSAAVSGTFGLGELLRAALDRAPARILVGLGGSASTDGGAGLAEALGYRLLDAGGRELPAGGAALRRLERIEGRGRDPRLAQVEIVAACDVSAPLLGPGGAAPTFGPQKGADPATVARLAQGLSRLAQVAERDLGGAGLAGLPGAGAAGGAGFGLAAFAGAKLVKGAPLVAEVAGLDRHLEVARLVITGEGRFDLQSLRGKAVGEVCRRARAAGVACLVVAGSADKRAAAELGSLGAGLALSGEGGARSAAAARRLLSEAVRDACLEPKSEWRWPEFSTPAGTTPGTSPPPP